MTGGSWRHAGGSDPLLRHSLRSRRTCRQGKRAFLRCEAFLYYTFPNFVTSIFIVCNLNLTDGFYSLLLCSFTILQSMSWLSLSGDAGWPCKCDRYLQGRSPETKPQAEERHVHLQDPRRRCPLQKERCQEVSCKHILCYTLDSWEFQVSNRFEFFSLRFMHKLCNTLFFLFIFINCENFRIPLHRKQGPHLFLSLTLFWRLIHSLCEGCVKPMRTCSLMRGFNCSTNSLR